MDNMPKTLPETNDFVTMGQAAKLLGVHQKTLRRWDQAGKISAKRLDGKNRYFSLSELKKIKEEKPLSISQVAKKLHVSVSTLRRMDKKGILKAERNERGDRVYESTIKSASWRIRPATKNPVYANTYAWTKERAFRSTPATPAYQAPKPYTPTPFKSPLQPLEPKTIDSIMRNAYRNPGVFSHLPKKPFSHAGDTQPALINTTEDIKNVLSISQFLSSNAVLGFLLFLLIMPALFFGVNKAYELAGGKQAKQKPLSEQVLEAAVLAADTIAQKGSFVVNIPTLIDQDATISGTLTAPNVIYSLTAGTGIGVTTGQKPTISNTGVLSLGGSTGELNLSAGSGISVSGLKVTNSGVTSLTAGTDTTVSGSTGGVTIGNSSTLATVTGRGATTTTALTLNGAVTMGSTLAVASTTTLSQITAPTTTTDKLYNVSGNLLWNGVNLSAGGALPVGTTGQTMYNSSGTWTATSNLYHDGTNVGIGTTTATYKLNVSTSTASDRGINIAHTAATGTNYGVYSSVIGAATANYAGYFSAANASTNYGVYVAAGSVNIQGLSASAGVYTDASKNLTSTVPTSGTVGYWSRTSTTLSPATANDIVSITGNSGDILTLTSSATGASNKALNVSQTGATVGTDYGGYFSNTGAATTNVGLYATASGGTNNYAAIFESGNVGIGTTAPAGLLDVSKSLSGTPSTTGKYLSLSSSTFTDNNTASSGTVSNMAFNSIAAPTLAASNTSVTTDHAATLYLAGAPTAGTNETITNSYALQVNSGTSAFGGVINLTNSSSTTVGTAVEGAWTMNSNTFSYKRTITVTNNDGSNALPSNYEVTVTLSGSTASQVYSHARGDKEDFRIAYNSTEIARNITTWTSSSIVFTFQLQASIAASGSSSVYYIYYSNSSLASGATTYTGNVQIDSLDTTPTSNWTSADTTQFPLADEATIKNEGTGSLKLNATVDNIGTFSTTSQNALSGARTNFGFTTAAISGTTYLYAVGGSTDGTAGNAQTTVLRTSPAAASGNVAAWSTNANSLSAAVMDNSVAVATPAFDGGTGADGTLDLSLGSGAGGCNGTGLTWTAGTSTCTIATGTKSTFNFTTINISSGTTLTTDGPKTTTNFVTIKATGAVTVAGTINLAGKGYSGGTSNFAHPAGYGPGAGTSGRGGCGGGYGGQGGRGSYYLSVECTPASTYSIDDSGSGGGSGTDTATYKAGGAGGGGIKFSSGGTVTATGTINANGGDGSVDANYSGGGGSGGRVYIQGTTITVSGSLTANGGTGGSAFYGAGGGGGGRITLEYSNSINTTGSTITVTAGNAGSGCGTNGNCPTAASVGTSTSSASNPILFVLGGKNTSGTAQSGISQATVTASDGSVGAFSASSVSLPQALFGQTSNAVTISSTNYLYIVGGNNGTSDQTTVYKGTFDSSGNITAIATTSQTQLGTGVSYHAAVTGTISSNNYIWVLGGLNGSTAQTTVLKGTIDSSGNITALTSTSQNALPQGLYGHQAVFATVGSNNYIYVYGGMTTGGTRQTTVYKATVDSSGNVGAWSTTGQTQLSSAISNFGAFNFTDSSSNQYAYIVGGNTGTVQTAVSKTKYTPIDQTTYSASRTITSSNWSNKNSLTFQVYSSLTGSYMNLQFYDATGGWQTCTFSVSSASTWETKTCDISGVSSVNKDAVTSLKLAVSSSSSSAWTAYLDDINAKTNASTISNTASGGLASLGAANLNLNAQGTGIVALNYDATNSLAGTGGLTVYNGGSTALFTVGSDGSLTATGAISGLTGYSQSSGTFTQNSTATSGGDFSIVNTGIATSGTIAALTANSATSGDLLTVSGTALTSGTLLTLTGPSGATAGVTDAGFKITSDVGNIGTSNGLIKSTAVFDGTTATGVNLYLNSSDAIAAANTNYGIYNTVSNTGALDSAATKTTYGSYTSVSSTGGAPTTAGTTNVYGQYITTTATNAADFGTVNNYGLYVANGTSSTNGTSTKYGIYVESPTGADSNYAAIFAGGNVGIGTTSPTSLLHIAGQCVTGDTLLKRRRRKRKNTSDGGDEGDSSEVDWEWEDVRIDEIQPGDEILTLDEKTGEFVPQKVKALMDMGIQTVIGLKTSSGKYIKTTNNHPYLVQIKPPKNISGIFEVDISGRVEEMNKDTYIALANKENDFVLRLPAKEKRILKILHASDHRSKFGFQVYAHLIIQLILLSEYQVKRLIIDHDYAGNEAEIKGIIVSAFPKVQISFASVGKSSPADLAAGRAREKIEKAITLSAKEYSNHKKGTQFALKGATEGPDRAECLQRSPTPRVPLGMYQKVNQLSMGETKWIKVANLNKGAKIATIDGWEHIVDIEELGRKQTFDIEVENTHNFVGNNIVAHNTAIFASGGVFGTNLATNLKLSNSDSAATNNAVNIEFNALRTGGQNTPVASISAIMTNTGSTTYTGGLAFSTAGTAAVPTERMRIDSSGNVGIGTTGPGAKLDVNGTANFTLPAVGSDSYLKIGSATATGFYNRFGTTASNQYAWFTNIYYTGSVFTKDDATKGAWRTNQVVDTTNSLNTFNIDYFPTGGVTAYTPLTLKGTSSGADLLINTGNVGIGTTTPAYKLDIATSTASDRGINIAHTATTGTNYGVYSSVTGAATANYGALFTATGATTSYGVAVAAMTSATSTGLDVGNMSGATANTGVNIGTLGTATTSKGVNIGAMSSATSTGVSVGALSGTTANRGVSVGAITAAATANNFGVDIGAITPQASATVASINTSGIAAGAGTATYGINLGTNASTATSNYGINVGAISGAGTTNYGLNIAAVSGATTNYAIKTAQGSVDLTDNSNTVASLALTNNTATTIGNGANTLGVIDLQSTSLTTGNFMNIELNALTTGKGINLTSTTTLTTGTMFNISNTSTALTSGSLIAMDWTPGSAVSGQATGDLFKLTIGANGANNAVNFLNFYAGSSSVFSVNQQAFTTSLPTNLTASGDLSIAYDINMTNPTASFIKSAAPLYLVAGETFNSSNLTLQTYNQGSVVIDSAQTTGNAVDITNSTLTTGNILGITETSTAGGASGSSYIINIAKSGANAYATHTSYGIASSVTNSGTTSVNYGGLFTATGATTNYGLAVAAMTGATSTGLDIGALSGATANKGINIGAISGAGTAAGITIGNLTNTGATAYLFNLGHISGANATEHGDMAFGNISGTTASAFGLSLGTLTGGTSTNYQITTSSLTAISSSTSFHLNLGTTAGATSATFGGLQINGISGAGTTSYGINIGSNTSTATTNYGIYTAAMTGTGTTNTGLYVGAVSGATNNYAAIFAGGNVGIGTTAPNSLLTVGALPTNYNSPSRLALYAAADSNLVMSISRSATLNPYQMFFGINHASGFGEIGMLQDGVGYQGALVLQRQGGNVGIGTTDPSFGGVAGSKFSISQTDASSGLVIGNATTPRFALNGLSTGAWTMYDYAAGSFTAGITQKSGNVGIGTTSPAGKLEIQTTTGGSIAADPTSSAYLQITGATADNSNYPNLLFKGGTLANIYPYISLGNGGLNLSLAGGRDSVTYTQRMKMNLSSNSAGSSNVNWTMDTGGAATTLMYLDGNTGNLGIGTTSPGSNLYVSGTGGITDQIVDAGTSNVPTGLGLVHTTSGTPAAGFGSDIHFQLTGTISPGVTGLYDTGDIMNVWEDPTTNHTSALTFSTYKATVQSERMRITGAGYVGIGTTSPAYVLDIKAPSGNDGVIRLQSNTAGSAGAPYLWFGEGGSSLGSVETGTNAAGNNYGAVMRIVNPLASARNGVNPAMIFLVGGSGAASERMRIDSGGNVGIGTTSPQATFSIAGGTAGNGRSDMALFWPTRWGFQQAASEQVSAGQIDYGSFDSTALSIVGKGSLSTNRLVRIFDAIGVNAAPSTNQALKVDGTNMTYSAVFTGGNVGIGTTAPTQTLEVGGNGLTNVLLANSDTGNPGAKLSVAGSLLTEQLNVAARTNMISSVSYYGSWTGWQTCTAGWATGCTVNTSTGNGFRGTAIRGVGTSSGHIAWATSGAQNAAFLVGKTYRVSFMYRSDVGLVVTDRDDALATVPANTGNAKYYSFTWTGASVVDPPTNGPCSNYGQVNSCFLVLGLSGSGYFEVGDLTVENLTDATPTYNLIADPYGNVGIGTTNPTSTLYVYGSFNSSNSTGGSAVGLGDRSITNYGNQYQYINFGGGTAGDDGWQVGKKNSAADTVGPAKGFYIYDIKNSLARMVIDTAGGNVGIGTTAPLGKLHIGMGTSTAAYKTYTASSTDQGLVMEAIQDINAPSRRIAYITALGNQDGTSGGGEIAFSTNPKSSFTSAVRMVIKEDGNVGIGTTAPGAPFEVKGTGTGVTIAKFTDVNTTGCTLATGGTISCSSDIRLKKNIDNLSYGLDAVMALRPVDYNWKTQADDSTKSLGFIAQEVEQVIPNLITTDSESGYKQLNTIGLVPVLTKAIQEQQLQIASLSAQFNSLLDQQKIRLAVDSLTKLQTSVATPDLSKIMLTYSDGIVKWVDPTGVAPAQPDLTDPERHWSEPTPISLSQLLTNLVNNQTFASIKQLTVGSLTSLTANISSLTANALQITTDNVTIAGVKLQDYITTIVDSRIGNSAPAIISPLASVDQLKTNTISPLASDTITVSGNASVSGILNSSQLTVSNDATVSGTLFVNKIKAGQIEGLDSLINQKTASGEAALSGSESIRGSWLSTNTNLSQNDSLVNSENGSGPEGNRTPGTTVDSQVPDQPGPTPTTSYQSLLSMSMMRTDYASIASLSGQLGNLENLTANFGQFNQGLIALGPTSLTDTAIAGQLTISGKMVLTDNTINTLGTSLELQPLRQGALSIMAGLITIDTDGNLTVSGNATFAKDVSVKGKLAANIISPLASSDLSINLGGNDSSSSSLLVNNASGSGVLKIDQQGNINASGSGTFTNIIANAFSIVRGAQADTSLTETVASGSAGTATIVQGETERTIINGTTMTEKSLVYLSPASDTLGLTPYIARQTKDSFTIQIPQSVSKDIKINWWIVN